MRLNLNHPGSVQSGKDGRMHRPANHDRRVHPRWLAAPFANLAGPARRAAALKDSPRRHEGTKPANEGTKLGYGDNLLSWDPRHEVQFRRVHLSSWLRVFVVKLLYSLNGTRAVMRA